jgi:hypothetical protein
MVRQFDNEPQEEIRLFVENACEMLAVADLMIVNGFFSSTCNRSY